MRAALAVAARAGRRVASMLVMLVAVASLTFLVDEALPSDAARMVAGPQARPADVARLRVELGLDRPLSVRYVRFLRRIVHVHANADASPEDRATHGACARLGPLHLDLGRSFQQRRPVVAILAERLPRTLALALAAVVVQFTAGVALGIGAARRAGAWIDDATMGASLLGLSAPTYLVGFGLQFVFGHRLGWLPLDGYGTTLADHALGLVMPAVTLGIFGLAYYARFARDEMVVALRADYVRTARAKGAGEARVLVVHALRNTLIPLATALALDASALVGGAVVTESLFRWPGLGALSVAAVLDRDGPLVMGTVLVSATAVLASNLAADALYAVLDPRLRR